MSLRSFQGFLRRLQEPLRYSTGLGVIKGVLGLIEEVPVFLGLRPLFNRQSQRITEDVLNAADGGFRSSREGPRIPSRTHRVP